MFRTALFKQEPPPRPPQPGCQWQKFTAYELRNGFIRPTHTAQTEPYDAMKTYWSARDSGAKAPHEDLLDVMLIVLRESPLAIELWPAGSTATESVTRTMLALNAFAIALPRFERLSRRSEQAILEWTAKYGPLGLALHEFSSVRFPARWSKPLDDDSLLLQTAHAAKTPYGWRSRLEYHRGIPAPDKATADSRIDPGFASEEGISFTQGNAVREDGEPVDFFFWARFFPDVDERTGTYALPGYASDTAFWSTYAEPIEEWLDGAVQLARFLVSCKNYTGAVPGGLVVTTGTDGKPSMDVCTPTLISALRLMAIHDHAAGTIRQCEAHGCGRWFFAAREDRMFCSATCKNRMTQHHYRRRQTQRAANANGQKERHGKKTRKG